MSDVTFEAIMDSNPDTTLQVDEGAPSFDDLDNLEKSRDEYKEQKTKDAKGTKEDKKDTGKKPEAKKSDGKAKEKPKSDKENETKSEHSAEQTEKEVKKVIKMLKGRVGEDSVELNPETVLDHKVDGQPVEVTVQDLLSNYSGKTAWDKKFSELGQERQKFSSDRDNLVGIMNNWQGKIQEVLSEDFTGDPTTAFDTVLDLIGDTGHTLRDKMLKYWTEKGTQMAGMSDEERNQYLVEQENDYLRQRNETYVEKQRQEQANAQFQSHVEHLRQTHNVSEQEFMEAIDGVEQLGKENYTAEDVIEFHQLKPHAERAEKLVLSVKPDISNEDYFNVVKELTDISRSDPSLADKDIVAALREEFGITGKVNEVNAKIKKNEAAIAVDNSKPGQLPSSGDYESFDDFDYYGV